jgi:site-specific recombinase XerD
MLALIDQYRKELEKVNLFADSTVDIYTASVKEFCEFAKTRLGIDPVKARGPHFLEWIKSLKNAGAGGSRIENHHHALKSFYAFISKTTLSSDNPAESLPLLIKRMRKITQPIDTHDAFKLLNSFDCSTWNGLRNYTMVSLFWALGLRTAELTGLKVRDFEPVHGNRIGLWRVRGKNKKQRPLFVVDRLFVELIAYQSHAKTPREKSSPLFPGDNVKTALSKNRIQRIVKDQARTAGILPEVTPRVLRHSFATEMYREKVPLPSISAMMGHASIAETSIYIHIPERVVEQVLETVRVRRSS